MALRFAPTDTWPGTEAQSDGWPALKLAAVPTTVGQNHFGDALPPHLSAPMVLPVCCDVTGGLVEQVLGLALRLPRVAANCCKAVA